MTLLDDDAATTTADYLRSTSNDPLEDFCHAIVTAAFASDVSDEAIADYVRARALSLIRDLRSRDSISSAPVLAPARSARSPAPPTPPGLQMPCVGPGNWNSRPTGVQQRVRRWQQRSALGQAPSPLRQSVALPPAPTGDDTGVEAEVKERMDARVSDEGFSGEEKGQKGGEVVV